MHIQKFIATWALAALTTTAASAQLLPSGPDDLTSETLIAAPQLKGMEVPKEAVALSWPLPADQALEPPTPHISRSREYFVDVTASELAAGIPLYTHGPGALVRLNPAPGAATNLAEKAAIAPSSLVLVDSDGKSWAAGSGMDLVVDPDQLKAAGVPFAPGTSAFRIREDLGAGNFTLRADGLAAAGAPYVVHVFDRASPIQLELTTGASSYLHGQTLIVEATLTDGSGPLVARRLEGFVTSPAGRAWPLRFQPTSNGLYQAQLILDAIELPTPGLWEVHASADGQVAGQALLRAARTAFGCAVPSARFSGASEIDRQAGLRVRLGVKVKSAGRYEARGVLYGTAADGSRRPAGIAHAATWLEAGDTSLELSFDRPLLAESALGAPYEVRDLRLIDQARMGLLHRQERAFVIDR